MRGVGFIYVQYIQSELMNVNAGIGYVYNYYSRLYTVNYFFRGIRYFNPS